MGKSLKGQPLHNHHSAVEQLCYQGQFIDIGVAVNEFRGFDF